MSKYKDIINEGTAHNLKTIHDQNYVDTVQVVRCKDCKHYHTGMFCEKWADFHPHAEEYPMVGSNGYCHYGERRDD